MLMDTSRLFCRILAALALPFTGVLCGAEPIVFSAEQNYRENFRSMPDVTLFRFEEGGLWAKRSKAWYGGAVYEPRGREKITDSGRVEAVFAYEGEQGVRTFCSLLARYDGNSGTALAGCVLVPSPERIRLVVRFNFAPFSPPGGPAPETLVDWEFDVKAGGQGYYRDALNRNDAFGHTGRSLHPGDRLIVRLEQTEKPQRAFRLTVLGEAGETIATTGFQSHERLSTLVPQGAVGMSAYVAPGDAIRFFSFAADTDE